ncbi:MAG: hypothetical protein N3B11_07655 [Coriobacteriia bacterium]|nr:hypothetical protein [Coriobacteriia bacterium]
MEVRPRGTGALIDDAIAMYRANARPILLAALVSVFPAALLVGIGQELYLRTFFEVVAASPGVSGPALPYEVLLGYGAVMAGAWLMLFGRAYLDTCVIAAAPRMMQQRVTDVRTFLKEGLPRYGWYLLTSWLVGILVQIAAVLSFVALFLGGLVAWALLSLAAAISVLERVDTAKAIKRSVELARPHLGRILRLVVFVALLTTLFEGALASPLIVRQIVAAVQNPEAVFQQTPLAWKIVEGIVLAGAMTLVAPFAPLATFALYTDVRARSEGMDIIIRARRLAERRK